jgi:hypothetical protein
MDDMHNKAMTNVLQQIIDLAKDGMAGQMSKKDEAQPVEGAEQDVSSDMAKLKAVSGEE